VNQFCLRIKIILQKYEKSIEILNINNGQWESYKIYNLTINH